MQGGGGGLKSQAHNLLLARRYTERPELNHEGKVVTPDLYILLGERRNFSERVQEVFRYPRDRFLIPRISAAGPRSHQVIHRC